MLHRSYFNNYVVRAFKVFKQTAEFIFKCETIKLKLSKNIKVERFSTILLYSYARKRCLFDMYFAGLF